VKLLLLATFQQWVTTQPFLFTIVLQAQEDDVGHELVVISCLFDDPLCGLFWEG